MKELLFVLFSIMLFNFNSFAQLADGTVAPDFTVTDINGNTHNLYDYLSDGKTVVIEFSATWCAPCWNYHQSGTLEQLYSNHGPDGDSTLMVIFIEGDALTDINDIEGNTADTQGDWTAGISFPIVNDDPVNVTPLYNIAYFPTIYTICPEATVYESGQINYTEHLSFIADNCQQLNGYNNAAIANLAGDASYCDTYIPEFSIINLGALPLTSADLELSLDGNIIETINWTGNLNSFQSEVISFSSVSSFNDLSLSLEVSNPNMTSDDDYSNNILNSVVAGPVLSVAQGLNLEITTDDWGIETYWAILDDADYIIAEGGNEGVGINGGGLGIGYSNPNAYNDNTYYNEFIELTGEGCYRFVLVDAVGDGIISDNGDDNVILTDVLGNTIISTEASTMGNYLIVDFYLELGSFEIITFPFYDANNDGVYDAATEFILQNQTFASNPVLTYFLDINGNGHFYTDSIGNYDINYNGNGTYASTNNPQTVILDTSDLVYELYFPMFVETPGDQLSLDLTSGITRCFQETNYWLTVNNDGTEFSEGVLSFTYSDTMSYFSASPAPDSIINQTLYFSFDNLAPTYNEQFLIVLSMPDFSFMGDFMNVTAELNSTTGITEQSSLSDELVCAYDPNDKQVAPRGIENDGVLNVESDTTLTYTIRFQNTGNDTAFNVVIKDTLSENLNWSTFNFISSSHNAIISIDNDKGVAEFNFENILLPDSGVNQLGSNGFIKFSIDIIDNLPINSVINNKAEIYFDFNPAIITNIVISVFKEIVGLVENESLLFEVYPNPSNGMIKIKSDFIYEKIEVVDLSGKVVLSKNGISENLDLTGLNSGSYFIKLSDRNNYTTRKLILNKL